MPDGVSASAGAGGFVGTGTLGPEQIAELWIQHGGPKGPNNNTVLTAVAVALAESGGDPNADNGTAAGVWQINYHAHTQHTAEELKDPDTNAEVAVSIYKALGTFGTSAGWVTYVSGAYKQFMTKDVADQVAKALLQGGDVQSGIGAVSDAVDSTETASVDVGDFLGKVTESLFTEKGWVRILKFTIGFGIGILAIKSLFQEVPLVGPAATAIVDAGKKAAEAAGESGA